MCEVLQGVAVRVVSFTVRYGVASLGTADSLARMACWGVCVVRSCFPWLMYYECARRV